MDGLFGPHDALDLPESARKAVGVVGEVRGFMTGIMVLLDDPTKTAAPKDLKGLSGNLQNLTTVLETEMNVVILSCARARQLPLAGVPPFKPIVH